MKDQRPSSARPGLAEIFAWFAHNDPIIALLRDFNELGRWLRWSDMWNRTTIRTVATDRMTEIEAHPKSARRGRGPFGVRHNPRPALAGRVCLPTCVSTRDAVVGRERVPAEGYLGDWSYRPLGRRISNPARGTRTPGRESRSLVTPRAPGTTGHESPLTIARTRHRTSRIRPKWSLTISPRESTALGEGDTVAVRVSVEAGSAVW
jgi:hypothetical protein